MGWASGSDLAQRIWDAVKDDLSPEAADKLARVIVEEFEGMDCDTLDEVEGPIGDYARLPWDQRKS